MNPPRLDVEPGGEFLVPWAKNKLAWLSAQVARYSYWPKFQVFFGSGGERVEIDVGPPARIKITGGSSLLGWGHDVEGDARRYGTVKRDLTRYKYVGGRGLAFDNDVIHGLLPSPPEWTNTALDLRNNSEILGYATEVATSVHEAQEGAGVYQDQFAAPGTPLLRVWVGYLGTYEAGAYFTFAPTFHSQPTRAASSTLGTVTIAGNARARTLLSRVNCFTGRTYFALYRHTVTVTRDADTGQYTLNVATTKVGQSGGFLQAGVGFDEFVNPRWGDAYDGQYLDWTRSSVAAARGLDWAAWGESAITVPAAIGGMPVPASIERSYLRTQRVDVASGTQSYALEDTYDGYIIQHLTASPPTQTSDAASVDLVQPDGAGSAWTGIRVQRLSTNMNTGVTSNMESFARLYRGENIIFERGALNQGIETFMEPRTVSLRGQGALAVRLVKITRGFDESIVYPDPVGQINLYSPAVLTTEYRVLIFEGNSLVFEKVVPNDIAFRVNLFNGDGNCYLVNTGEGTLGLSVIEKDENTGVWAEHVVVVDPAVRNVTGGVIVFIPFPPGFVFDINVTDIGRYTNTMFLDRPGRVFEWVVPFQIYQVDQPGPVVHARAELWRISKDAEGAWRFTRPEVLDDSVPAPADPNAFTIDRPFNSPPTYTL